MPVNGPIGGVLLGGGWINQSDISNTINGTPEGAFSVGGGSTYQRGIPVRHCQLLQRFQEEPLRISGLLGAATTRRIAFQGVFSFTIWFDQSNPIEPATPGGGGGIPSFRQRDPFQLVFLLGFNPRTSTYHRAYYAPRCVCDGITPVWDEESDPRKCIGEEVTGHTKGWTFLLPDDGSPSDPTTIVGAYLAYLAAGGKDLV